MNKEERMQVFYKIRELLEEYSEKDGIDYFEGASFVFNGKQHEIDSAGKLHVTDRDSDDVVDVDLIPDSQSLLIVYDGGWLYDIFNSAHYFEIEEELSNMLEKLGFYREPVYSWASVIVEY